MTSLTNFAIIGTGSVSDTHAKAIKQLEGARLVAICSSSEARAKEAEQHFGVPAYNDYHDMLAREDIQIVNICTESGRHLQPALAAAEAGKHILCEKPLEVNLERADQMIAACRKAGVRLGCVFQNRFSDDYRKLKAAVEAGVFGSLHLANAYIKWYRDDQYYQGSHWRGTLWGDGGGALINQSIHTIDLLLDVMGEVESVYAKVKTVAHEIEGEDLGVAMLNFRSDALGTIEGTTAAYPGYPERLEIYGERGSAVLESGRIVAWKTLEDTDKELQPTPSNPSGAADPTAIGYELHRRQIKDMMQAVQEGREPLVNGEEGRKALALVRAIYHSSEENSKVSVQ